MKSYTTHEGFWYDFSVGDAEIELQYSAYSNRWFIYSKDILIDLVEECEDTPKERRQAFLKAMSRTTDQVRRALQELP